MSVYVRVLVGGDQFALPVEYVREIARLGEISPVPGSGNAVIGVRNLRGQVLPVFDLAALLGVSVSGWGSRIVVVEESGRRAGLAIDEVTDVASLPAASGDAGSEFVSGTSLVDEDSVGLIDIPSVVSALQERAAR